jgi:transglutaminase-like putative cysteine protease
VANSDARLKLQVIKDSETYTYDIEQGTDQIFPLQCGDGTYTIKVMKNVGGSSYYELYVTTADVKLDDPLDPYLRPNAYADYSESSDCVKKAAEISAKAGSAMDVVSGVYELICSDVTYDKEKAATVQTGYLPTPDETLSSGKGICFDYASLAAAMLRSQGIPTKVIFGYVAPDNLYHAWNMFYTEETGWVTVDYKVSGDSWNRLDLTFASNGADSEFIGDGSHYSDVYFY